MFLKKTGGLAIVVSASCIACIAFVVGRMVLTGKNHYWYLVWNLFLAAVPFIFSIVAHGVSHRMENQNDTRKRSYAWLFSLIGLWLLFYPNAPYIFTDFIHLINRTYSKTTTPEFGRTAILWFDIIMNSAFSFIGHVIGLFSLYIVHSIVSKRWGKPAGWILVSAASILSGFGIYLGRFSRLNSWDLFLHPIVTATEIWTSLMNIDAILFSFVFAVFIGVTYALVTSFKRIDF